MRIRTFSLALIAAMLAIPSANAAKPAVIVPPGEVVRLDDLEIKKPLVNAVSRRCRVCAQLRRRALHQVGAARDLGRFQTDLRRATIMPGFHVDRRGMRTPAKFRNTTILTAQEVEDLVSYLLEMGR
jgi:hypothetical protein